MTRTAIRPDSSPASTEPIERVLDLEMLQASRSAGDPLSLIQLRALLSLADIGKQSARGLANQLRVERSVIERLCPPLLTRGFLIQIPHGSVDDSSAIVLSTAGQRFVNHLLYRNTDEFERRRKRPLAHPDSRTSMV